MVPSVEVTELPAGAVLVDVRELDEWEAGHAPDAVHIPMTEFAGRLGEVPNDAEVYVICRSGGRSARVTAYLNQNGWDAFNVTGGMQSWAVRGLPMIGADPSVQPSVI